MAAGQEGGKPVPLSELLEQAHYAYMPNKALASQPGKPLIK